jgi:hypothetical protein
MVGILHLVVQRTRSNGDITQVEAHLTKYYKDYYLSKLVSGV